MALFVKVHVLCHHGHAQKLRYRPPRSIARFPCRSNRMRFLRPRKEMRVLPLAGIVPAPRHASRVPTHEFEDHHDQFVHAQKS